jgi:hypothetical protein
MNDWAEYRHIRYLLEILNRGGVRADAEVLRTSAPNLSTQAIQFEDHFSIRLNEKRADNRIVLPQRKELPAALYRDCAIVFPTDGTHRSLSSKGPQFFSICPERRGRGSTAD